MAATTPDSPLRRVALKAQGVDLEGKPACQEFPPERSWSASASPGPKPVAILATARERVPGWCRRHQAVVADLGPRAVIRRELQRAPSTGNHN